MDVRRDLVEGLLQAVFVVEKARSGVLRGWGGDFANEAEGATKRTDRLERLLRDMSISVPVPGIQDGHTAWLRALCGQTPTSVALGAALLQRFGAWPDVYAEPYLGNDFDEFRTLGEAELRLPTTDERLTQESAFLPAPETPDGRRYAILTDVHIGADGADELARLAVADINASGVEFVVLPGDITDDGEPEQFALAKQILDGLEVPYHAVLGNHDAVQRSTRAENGALLFADAFGRPSRDTLVRCGDVQIAIVDSSDPTACPFPDWDLSSGGFRDDAAGVWSGALEPGQASALASQLDPSMPVLLILHHELQPFPGFPPVSFGLRQTDSDELLSALSGHRLAGIVAGHTHRSAALHVGPSEDVPQLELPALKDWPYCWTLVTITDDAIHVTPRQIADRDAVWERSRNLYPIYRNHALGPLTSLDHRFEL